MTHDELLAKLDLPNPWRCDSSCNHDTQIKYGAGGFMPNPNGAGGGIVVNTK